jgi:hypothetical protein
VRLAAFVTHLRYSLHRSWGIFARATSRGLKDGCDGVDGCVVGIANSTSAAGFADPWNHFRPALMARRHDDGLGAGGPATEDDGDMIPS